MKTKAAYWTFTLLFALPTVASSVAFLIGVHEVVAGMIHLGYPVYLLPFLGVAKLLGVTAILTGRFPRLKEWAYAGFTFDMLGALYSHLATGEPKSAVQPLVILSLMLASRASWRNIAPAQSARCTKSSVTNPDPCLS